MKISLREFLGIKFYVSFYANLGQDLKYKDLSEKIQDIVYETTCFSDEQISLIKEDLKNIKAYFFEQIKADADKMEDEKIETQEYLQYLLEKVEKKIEGDREKANNCAKK